MLSVMIKFHFIVVMDLNAKKENHTFHDKSSASPSLIYTCLLLYPRDPLFPQREEQGVTPSLITGERCPMTR